YTHGVVRRREGRPARAVLQPVAGNRPLDTDPIPDAMTPVGQDAQQGSAAAEQRRVREQVTPAGVRQGQGRVVGESVAVARDALVLLAPGVRILGNVASL